MAKTARERLARLLGDSEPAGSFSAQLLAPAHVLQLEVSGVGPVSLPVRAPLAKKLIAVARPAMFGRGEETLTDTNVRDTWELTPDQITLGGPGWTALMNRALEHFRDELGLPQTSRLRAEPHSMLVYGKGQFFLPHQDSEKDDAMVGTLVASLPSAHTGGELVIDHAGESTTYRASKEELTFVAFYADCRHQVTPVRSGYRVTLTFNLLSGTETPAPEADPATELAHCLTEHFTTPPTPQYGSRDLGLPNRLVFLLDHEYTQRGLNWRRLKGADAERAALVRAAAEQAGCETVLALAEVKETWDALPSDSDRWDDYNYYEDEDDGYRSPSEDPADFQLTELIDDEITLGWWTSPDGTGGEPISLHVPDYEVCASTPSMALAPYQSEYEGYMGNYGNTLDRWYRRAAVVVWPQDRAFAARAQAGSQWALHELRDRIDAGDLEGARAAAESLAPFWKKTASQAGLLGAALDVAAGLGVAGTAAMLLEPFRVETVTQEHAGGLAAAAGRYSEDWTRSVIDGWFGSGHHFGTDLSEWVDNRLPGLCGALRTTGRPEVARLLAAGAWRWMGGQLRLWTTTPRSEVRQPRLEMLSSPLVRLLEAVDDKLCDEITGTLRECGDNALECLMPALRLADVRRAVGLDTVARDCAQRLGTIIARPLRDEDDWSIEWTGCGCGLCDTLGTFLGSRSQRNFAWPLATDGRRHVHTQIDSAALPVRHQTRRQGRPYTLVLTKTDELFTRATNARHKAVTDLAWLTSTRGDASART
ncbi:2OG-Fe(II) oxygenase [Aeromicrobium sp.]|uniref:2OG-Fe(II) oxygenase n=1 Tax=Aeromicrobium sp. TaxID=1871063 RepID=UPI003D6A2547